MYLRSSANSLAVLLGIGASLLLGGRAAKSAPSMQQPAHQTLRQERKDYERKMQKELDELDRRVTEWKAESARESSRARAQFNREIQDLSRKSDVAREKLRELENSKRARASWRDMRKGVDLAVRDLRTAYHRAEADLSKSNSPAGC
jgi:DNA mismatch repair ATPase MutS